MDAVWLGVADADPKIMASDAEKLGIKTDATSGWIEYEIPKEVLLSTRMYLTQEMVKDLLKCTCKASCLRTGNGGARNMRRAKLKSARQRHGTDILQKYSSTIIK